MNRNVGNSAVGVSCRRGRQVEIILRMTDWRMNGRCVYKSTLFKAICK